MANGFTYRGFPSIVVSRNFKGKYYLDMEEGAGFESLPLLFTGNLTNEPILVGQAGKRYRLKAFLLTSQTNNGSIKLYRETGNTLILPMYIGQGSASVSSSFNLLLDEGEGIYATTTGIGGNEEVFIGVTYTENLLEAH